MADTQRYRHGEVQHIQVPVENATAISIGDLIKLDTGFGVRATAAGDNLTLLAIAQQAHANGDGDITINCIRVEPGSEWVFPLDGSTVIAMGDELQISGAQELTASAANPVANATEAGTLTSVICEFKMPVALIGDTA